MNKKKVLLQSHEQKERIEVIKRKENYSYHSYDTWVVRMKKITQWKKEGSVCPIK